MPAANEAALLFLMTNYTWRGEFANDEINALHALAFETRIFTADEWDWNALVGSHSLGWVVARDDDVLVGFVNVVWDGWCMHGFRTRWCQRPRAVAGLERSWSPRLGMRPEKQGASTCMSTSSRTCDRSISMLAASLPRQQG
jgi:hypothetical protein